MTPTLSAGRKRIQKPAGASAVIAGLAILRKSFWLANAAIFLSAHLFPVIGVVFLAWRLGDLMALVAVEAVIVTTFSAVRIGIIAGVRKWVRVALPFVAGSLLVAVVYLQFVIAFFGEPGDSGATFTRVSIETTFVRTGFAVLGLLISHGISFVVSARPGPFNQKAQVEDLRSAQTIHVVFLWLLVFPGIILKALGGQGLALLWFVGLKLLLDGFLAAAERGRALRLASKASPLDV